MITKPENTLIEEVNRLAVECYRFRQDGNVSEFDNKMTKLYNLFLELMKKRLTKSSHGEDILLELFEYQWGYSQKQKAGWNPDEQPPFYQATASLLERRLHGQPESDPRKVPLDDGTGTTGTDGSGGEQSARPLEKADLNPGPAQLAEEKDTIICVLEIMNDAVRMQKQKAPNKFCYPVAFYTEFVSKMIHDHIIPAEDVPGRTADRIDLVFAESYMDRKIKSIPDIAAAELKKLSCFTGKDTDAEKYCGYDLKSAVYRQYIQSSTGKMPNDSAISQQRTKFQNLVCEWVPRNLVTG